MTARLKALLVSGSLGKLSAKDFKHMPAGSWPTDGYTTLLKPLGVLQRLDLLERREMGDDRVYIYDAVYATQTLRVDFALAPDEGISSFAIEPK